MMEGIRPMDSAEDDEHQTNHSESQELKEDVARRDTKLIQIHASKAEIDRRIAAFQSTKQAEKDEINQMLFRLDRPDPEYSCARVDAVYSRRYGNASRVPITRVYNSQGPQTQAYADVPATAASNLASSQATLQSVEERLRNTEQHLGINKDAKADVFSRLKAVEERILFLEGLSLEYFQDGVPPPKINQNSGSRVSSEEFSHEDVKDEYDSISDIDERIFALRKKLKGKSRNWP